MVRARKLGVLTAVLYAVDVQEASISMERVDGSTVKALLHSSTLQGAGAGAYAVDRRGYNIPINFPAQLSVLAQMRGDNDGVLAAVQSSTQC